MSDTEDVSDEEMRLDSSAVAAAQRSMDNGVATLTPGSKLFGLGPRPQRRDLDAEFANYATLLTRVDALKPALFILKVSLPEGYNGQFVPFDLVHLFALEVPGVAFGTPQCTSFTWWLMCYSARPPSEVLKDVAKYLKDGIIAKKLIPCKLDPRGKLEIGWDDLLNFLIDGGDLKVELAVGACAEFPDLCIAMRSEVQVEYADGERYEVSGSPVTDHEIVYRGCSSTHVDGLYTQIACFDGVPSYANRSNWVLFRETRVFESQWCLRTSAERYSGFRANHCTNYEEGESKCSASPPQLGWARLYCEEYTIDVRAVPGGHSSKTVFDGLEWPQASEWQAPEWQEPYRENADASEWQASAWEASEWQASEWQASEWQASEWQSSKLPQASEWQASEWQAFESQESLNARAVPWADREMMRPGGSFEAEPWEVVRTCFDTMVVPDSSTAVEFDLGALKQGSAELERIVCSVSGCMSFSDANGVTLVHLAALLGNPKVTADVTGRADPARRETWRDKDGRTPLHYAAAHNLADDVALLISFRGKSDVNVDRWGNTPLRIAMDMGNVEFARALRELGYGKNSEAEESSEESAVVAMTDWLLGSSLETCPDSFQQLSDAELRQVAAALPLHRYDALSTLAALAPAVVTESVLLRSMDCCECWFGTAVTEGFDFCIHDHAFLIPVWEHPETFSRQPRALGGAAVLLSAPADLPPRPLIAERAVFNARFAQRTGGALAKINWNHVMVVGGMVLGCFAFDDEGFTKLFPETDVDIYIVGLQGARFCKKVVELVETIHGCLPGATVVRTAQSITICPGTKRGRALPNIQIVLAPYATPAHLLFSADIDCTSIGFDGVHCLTTPRARESLVSGRNIARPEKYGLRGEWRSEARLLKYVARGFQVVDLGLKPGEMQSHSKQSKQHLVQCSSFFNVHQRLPQILQMILVQELLEGASQTCRGMYDLVAAVIDDAVVKVAHIAAAVVANDILSPVQPAVEWPFSKEKGRKIVLTSADDEKGLGIHISLGEARDRPVLQITSIIAGGFIDEWNQANPTEKVSIKDTILALNGKATDKITKAPSYIDDLGQEIDRIEEVLNQPGPFAVEIQASSGIVVEETIQQILLWGVHGARLLQLARNNIDVLKLLSHDKPLLWSGANFTDLITLSQEFEQLEDEVKDGIITWGSSYSAGRSKCVIVNPIGKQNRRDGRLRGFEMSLERAAVVEPGCCSFVVRDWYHGMPHLGRTACARIDPQVWRGPPKQLDDVAE